MSFLRSLLSLGSALVPALFTFAQKTPVDTNPANIASIISQKDLATLPFAKGNWELLTTPYLGYNYTNKTLEPETGGYAQKFNLNLGTTYFLANHVGLGLDFRLGSNGDHFQANNINTQWMGSLGLKYGISLSHQFGIYGQASYGLGESNSTDKSGSYSTTTKDNLSEFHFEFGAPIRLYGPEYFTPFVSYNHLTTSFTGGKEINSGFGFGFRMETYFGCSDYMCDRHHEFSISDKLYQPGTSFFDFTTSGKLGFGTIDTKNSGYGSTSGSIDYSCESICLSYGYYLLPGLAGGLRLGYDGNTQKNDASNFKMNTSRFMISPMLELNAPFSKGWNNLFLNLEAGFGRENSSNSNFTSSTSTKTNIFNYGGFIGYNNFFSKYVALTPKLGYEFSSLKFSDSDYKQHNNGIKFEVGLRLFLNPGHVNAAPGN
jgi:hypothetical protein